jgi:hypothetical protein
MSDGGERCVSPHPSPANEYGNYSRRGDPRLEDETYLRNLIETLLKKDSPNTSPKKATASR